MLRGRRATMLSNFQDWMRRVDAVLNATASVDSNDLADWGYKNAFEDEMPPEEAAQEVLVENGWEL